MLPLSTRRQRVRWLRPFQIDVRSLAAMRIALGLVLLYELAGLLPMAATYFSDWGVLPRSAQLSRSANFTLYAFSGSTGWATSLVWLEIIAALLLTVGYQTRAASIALLVLILSAVNRNPLFIHAGQPLQMWLLVWSFVLPLGAAASVDARLMKKSSRMRPRIRRVATLGTVVILWQVVFVYFSSVTAKSHADWTTDFTALYYSLRSHYATPLGYQLSAHADLLGVLTLGTLLLEALGPVVAMLAYGMPRVRTITVFTMMAFHLGILATMYVGTFSLTCCAAWMLFLPSSFWNMLERHRIWLAIRAGWGALIGAIAGGVDRLTRAIPLIARRNVAGIQVHRFTWACVGLLFAYVVLVNVVYDMPNALARFAGPLNRIPRLKQNWGVFASSWKAYSAIGIDVTLANGTTRTLKATDLPDGAFRRTLALRSSRDEYFQFAAWPPEYAMPTAFRGMMLGSASEKIEPLRAFCEFHRRLWDDAHADPKQKIISLNSYWVLDYTVPPNMPPGRPVPSTRVLQYAWPEPASPRK